MPFTKGASNATGPYSPGGTQTYQQANNAEYQYDEATQSLPQDLFSPFVQSGGVCTIHGGLPKQLDFTQIVLWPKQTDNRLRRQVVSASNFTSSAASTTYYFDVNPDGTTSWGTAHSGTANYVSICSVTTDGSQNLVTITDLRPLTPTLVVNGAGFANVVAADGASTARDPLTFVVIGASDSLPAAGIKGRVLFKLPFNLP